MELPGVEKLREKMDGADPAGGSLHRCLSVSRMNAGPHCVHAPGASSMSAVQRFPPCSQGSGDLPPICPLARSQAPGLPSQGFHSCQFLALTGPRAPCWPGLACVVNKRVALWLVRGLGGEESEQVIAV